MLCCVLDDLMGYLLMVAETAKPDKWIHNERHAGAGQERRTSTDDRMRGDAVGMEVIQKIERENERVSFL